MDAAASNLSTTPSQAPVRARARATRRTGGARRPAAKGGPGRGRAGKPHPPSFQSLATVSGAQARLAHPPRPSRTEPPAAHSPRGRAMAAFIPFHPPAGRQVRRIHPLGERDVW